MKFIEWGIKDNDFAYKDVEVDGIPKNSRANVRERYFRVYMPWWRRMYNVDDDREGLYQPCFHFYWHEHPASRGMCTVARWGWQ